MRRMYSKNNKNLIHNIYIDEDFGSIEGALNGTVWPTNTIYVLQFKTKTDALFNVIAYAGEKPIDKDYLCGPDGVISPLYSTRGAFGASQQFRAEIQFLNSSTEHGQIVNQYVTIHLYDENVDDLASYVDPKSVKLFPLIY